MATAGFNGLTVAAFESRMATEIARLIQRHGGVPLVTPALREIPLDDNSAALKFGVKLTTERVDLLILLTGVGTTALFDLLKTRYPWPSIVAALKQTALVARGPKPVAALKAFGLQPTLTVPEPNTWVDLISTLDEYRPVKGLRVAVQEYGVSNPDLLEALKQRGAEVFQVPIYRWALPKIWAAQTGGSTKSSLGRRLCSSSQTQPKWIMLCRCWEKTERWSPFVRRSRRWSSPPSAPPPANDCATTSGRSILSRHTRRWVSLLKKPASRRTHS